ncbi:MAG TPA: 1-(5-phosphoribosyl)-5-[(5-phosphoribosylamino)methylideneamino] imidazole-4-carboxamide isomerase [Gemmatimonadales bacterium]|nr:1-(5-phosphoribosyl)-5-[(5-phosphoribosylamino)methylideneamino] imidazole-4-carboxamide isomerase [Gemmatimonadales bacterium]
MDLYPAIDIRNGRVVRLSQGEATRQTVYGTDPVAVAERFAELGARWLHVVDLDRAFGEGDNEEPVRRVLERVRGRVRVQLGGGLRSLDLVLRGIELGAERVVIGTAAALDAGFLAAAAAAVGAVRLAAGVDARDGRVAVRGWTEISTLTAADLADRALAAGIETLIYTDVTRDGMLQGPDVAGALALQARGAAVIASGGVSSLEDLRRIADAGLAGAIVGRALYECRFDLRQALEAAGARSRSV